MDSRYAKLADNLAGYSIALKKADKVLIEAFEVPDDMVIALIRAVRSKNAIPFVRTHHAPLLRELLTYGEEDYHKTMAKQDLSLIKQMDAYIGLRGSHNIFEFSSVPPRQMKQYMEKMRPSIDWRVKKTRWVVLRWPTPAMAQQASMSSEAFADFYFKVCTLDYGRMKPGMAALKRLMERTDLVHITGPETDLVFSIKGQTAIPCGGHRNIPDGEVFTSPVRDSVNGVLTHNAPTVYQGVSFDGIRLEFENGRIVKATAEGGRTRRLNDILDSDPGARFVGEFALGFNPLIREPMRDILFDEKIAGSFHFTPGQAYDEADNGNRSQVHWDMVSIQRRDWGGGEIRFDGKVIRKDGLFLPKALQQLNPDFLSGKDRAKPGGQKRKDA